MKTVRFKKLLEIIGNPHRIAKKLEMHPQEITRFIDNDDSINIETGRVVRETRFIVDLSLLDSDQRKLLEQILKEKGEKNV